MYPFESTFNVTKTPLEDSCSRQAKPGTRLDNKLCALLGDYAYTAETTPTNFCGRVSERANGRVSG